MSDETLIRDALTEWAAAFCTKDAARLAALYAADAVIYDAIPPWTSGVDALRAKTEDCLRCLPDRFAIETRELRLELGADLAVAHFLWRFVDLPPDHPAGICWMRSSIVWRKRDGGWRIAHDHSSVPFDPLTSTIVTDLDADYVACDAPPPARRAPAYPG